jgi:hypothetical protein
VLLGCCTIPTALHHGLQTAQPQVWAREVWLDAVCSPRKCLPKARSYLGGLNASLTRPFVGMRRLCDPWLGASTEDTNRRCSSARCRYDLPLCVVDPGMGQHAFVRRRNLSLLGSPNGPE